MANDFNNSIFHSEIANRNNDQETKKADIGGIESKKVPERINLSLPADCKKKFLDYCKNHYTTPSSQLRAWIDENCNE